MRSHVTHTTSGLLARSRSFLAAHWEGGMCLIILDLVRNLLRALTHFGAGVTLKGRISPTTKTLGDLGAGGYKPWQYFWYQALIRSKECEQIAL